MITFIDDFDPIRHAKSSWSDLSLDDFDRPLNERGRRDAPKMAKWFSENIQETAILFSSPANRALSTAKYFEKELTPIKFNIVDAFVKLEASATV